VKNKRGLIIAIDGPAASGKSTTAKLVAEKLDYLYLDTGAMYRAMTLKALREKVDLGDPRALAQMAARTRIELIREGKQIKTLLDGQDVSREIRSPEVTANINSVCEVPEVRRVLVDLQRKAGEKGGVVVEGRDIGTVVFPHADLKFYMVASLEERAKRRLKELRSMGMDAKIEQVREQIRRRDELDSSRTNGPLKRAEDAILLDTTDMSIQEQVEFIVKKVKEKKNEIPL